MKILLSEHIDVWNLNFLVSSGDLIFATTYDLDEKNSDKKKSYDFL